MVLVEVRQLVVDIDGSGNVLPHVERDLACPALLVRADHAIVVQRVCSVVLEPACRVNKKKSLLGVVISYQSIPQNVITGAVAYIYIINLILSVSM